jgi:hypothetical protein
MCAKERQIHIFKVLTKFIKSTPIYFFRSSACKLILADFLLTRTNHLLPVIVFDIILLLLEDSSRPMAYPLSIIILF